MNKQDWHETLPTDEERGPYLTMVRPGHFANPFS